MATKKKKVPNVIMPMGVNFNSLAVEICKREGKKVQVNIAQVKEILKILVDMMSEGPVPICALSMAVIVKRVNETKKEIAKVKKK